MVASVPQRSLSIVPGIPITGILNSCAKTRAPVNVPSPPITISASIPSRLIVSYANWRPSLVGNSAHRADLIIVPPREMIPLTSCVVNGLTSPSISPL